MSFFVSFAAKLLPLYLYIILGIIAGRKLSSNSESIAKIIFYIISPLVILNGVINTKLDAAVLSVPFISFIIASILCLAFYRFSKKLWQDASRNIMAFSAGSGATGFFGLPIAMILFDTQTEGVYIMALLGMTLYENSLGYYMMMRGTFTNVQCAKKILALPTLYAFLGGIIINICHLPLPNVYYEFMDQMKSVYVVLGMMIIGLGLSSIARIKLDPKFISMAFLAKFIVWPVVVLAIIAIDGALFGIYDIHAQEALILLSIVPLAVNSIVMASMINFQPEKIAITVLLSAIFAFFYIPLMSFLFLESVHDKFQF